jgi:uncharacterized membrane protein
MAGLEAWVPATTEAVRSGSAARPGLRPAVLAWALFGLVLLGFAAFAWLDRLLRQAGRPDLALLAPFAIAPSLAALTASTVGAVLASRRPRHPVGWLLLGLGLSMATSAVAAGYVSYGLVVRPGALPAADAVARVYGPLIYLALATLGFVLLLTPTGSPPTRRWRWWARASAGAMAVLLVAATLAPGSLDPVHLTLEGPLDGRGFGGALQAANLVAQAVALLMVMAGGGSLVVRFRRARGVERQQLRWVALAAALTGVAMVVFAVLLALGSQQADWISAGATVFLPLDFGRGRGVPAGPSPGAGGGRPALQLTAEVLAVVDQTMQPTQAWLWQRPPPARAGR